MQVSAGIESNNLVPSFDQVQQTSRCWISKTLQRMRKLREHGFKRGKSDFRFARIGVCVGCGLYCFTSGIESELSNAATDRISHLEDYHPPPTWSPGYWQTMGSLLGCLMSGIILCYMGRLSSLLKVAVPCLLLACIMTYISTQIVSPESSLFLFISTLQIFIQNVNRSLSIIIPPIYILETLCHYPGGYESKAAGVLGALTQLPPAIASLTMTLFLVDTHKVLLLPVLAAVTALILYLYAPESPRWLMVTKGRTNEARRSLRSLRSKNILQNEVMKELDEMQSEMQTSLLCEPDCYVRPLLVLSGLLLLVELMGYGAYQFYMSWAYTFSGLTLNSNFVSSFIRFCTTLMSTIMSLLFPGPKCTSLMLLISTSFLIVCLVITGTCMYILEQEGMKSKLIWIPATFLTIYQIAFWLGIGTYSIPVCTLISPAKSRPIVLTISVTVYQMTSYFCQTFLPLMISVLHPFGVFWLHAGLASVGLIYIILVIVPELKWMAKNVSGDHTNQVLL